MPMDKTVVQRTEFEFQPAAPGLRAVDIAAREFPVEPILVFTEFHMSRPVFGPHPHAGISVMTYLLPDSAQGFVNRDSLGDRSDIEPGGLHVLRAGRGMFHDEYPRVPGIDAHGFQIWINHREGDRWAEPGSFHAPAAAIDEVHAADFKVRILHGAFGGQRAASRLPTELDLFHVFLRAGGAIELPAREMAFVYGLRGTGAIGTTGAKAQTLVTFGPDGDRVRVAAGADGFDFMFASAMPLREPIVYGGPFVMTTAEQMRATRQRLAAGAMGRLEPAAP